MARVDRRRGGHPGGRGRPHRRGPARGRAAPVRRPSTSDRFVLGRLQRDRHHHRHARHLRPAAPARGTVLLGLRGGGALCGHRDVWPVYDASPGVQGRGLPVPAQVRRRAGHARRAGGPPGSAAQPGADRARRRHRRLRQPVRAPLHRRPGPPRGGRHAGHRRVDPGRPGLRAQAGRRHRRDPGPRGAVPAPGGGRVGSATRTSRSSATSPPTGCRSCPLWSNDRAGCTCTTTSWSPCCTTCSGSSPGAAARAPARTATACSASTSTGRTGSSRRSSPAARASSPGWVRVSFNYFISDATFSYIVDAVDLVATHGWLLLPEYRFNPTTGLWRHRGGLVEPPMRLSQLSLRVRRTPAHPGPVRTGPGVRARRLPGRGPGTVREAGRAAPIAAPASGARARVSAGFEELRWFDLPDVCLTGS